MKKNKKNKVKEVKDMVVVNGVVIESFANAMFDVKLENDRVLKCRICGRIRINKIRIIPGDKVQVGISIYDTNNGIILYRLKD